MVAPATKGGRFSIARQGGCMVLYKLAPNFFEGAYHGLCPLSEATQPLARATAQGHTPLCVQRPQDPSEIAAPPTGIYQQMIPYGRLPQTPPSTTDVVPLPPTGGGRQDFSQQLLTARDWQ